MNRMRIFRLAALVLAASLIPYEAMSLDNGPGNATVGPPPKPENAGTEHRGAAPAENEDRRQHKSVKDKAHKKAKHHKKTKAPAASTGGG